MGGGGDGGGGGDDKSEFHDSDKMPKHVESADKMPTKNWNFVRTPEKPLRALCPESFCAGKVVVRKFWGF